MLSARAMESCFDFGTGTCAPLNAGIALQTRSASALNVCLMYMFLPWKCETDYSQLIRLLGRGAPGRSLGGVVERIDAEALNARNRYAERRDCPAAGGRGWGPSCSRAWAAEDDGPPFAPGRGMDPCS